MEDNGFNTQKPWALFVHRSKSTVYREEDVHLRWLVLVSGTHCGFLSGPSYGRGGPWGGRQRAAAAVACSLCTKCDRSESPDAVSGEV